MKKTILITLVAALSMGNSFAQEQMHPVKPANQVAPNPSNPKAINPKNPVDPKGTPVNPKNPVDKKPSASIIKNSAKVTTQPQEKEQEQKQMQLQKHHVVVPPPAAPMPKK